MEYYYGWKFQKSVQLYIMGVISFPKYSQAHKMHNLLPKQSKKTLNDANL